MKYLTLIRSIALLASVAARSEDRRRIDGQPFEYIEATRDDVKLAKKIVA